MFFELDTAESKEKLTGYIEKIHDHIKTLAEDQLSEHQKLFLRLIDQYGNSDIGIIFTFFFNILKLQKGESFVISPDEPHAYIAGDLVEAMVNSDNVVRGGLTPKFKDTQTLVDMLKYEFKDRKQNSGETLHDVDNNKIVQYKTGFEEFMVTNITMNSSESTIEQTFTSCAIAMVLNGSATAETDGFPAIQMEEKQAYYIMPGQKFKLNKTQEDQQLSIFIASCDI